MPTNEVAKKMIAEYYTAYDAQHRESDTLWLKEYYHLTDEAAKAMYEDLRSEDLAAAISSGRIHLPRDT